jgi:hypothetical protein
VVKIWNAPIIPVTTSKNMVGEQRQGDVPDLRPAYRAIHGSCLIQFFGMPFKPGQENQHIAADPPQAHDTMPGLVQVGSTNQPGPWMPKRAKKLLNNPLGERIHCQRKIAATPDKTLGK